MKARFVMMVLAASVALALAAGVSDLSNAGRPADRTTDALGVPGSPGRPTDGFTYTVEWAFGVNQIGSVGLTGVQDTLVWVSSGGPAGGTADTNWILVYDARTRVRLDSFKQYVQAPTSNWGYRDMYYDAAENAVYAGCEGNRMDKIDATTHAKIATYTLTGSPTPTLVRGLTGDGDSLYVCNFASTIIKCSKTGTNCHTVAPAAHAGFYGLALAKNEGKVYGTTASYDFSCVRYNYPAWTVADTTLINQITGGTMGGSEMFHGDTFLLVLGQMSLDSVFCLRRIASAAIDVGAAAVLAPPPTMAQGAVAPKVLIQNFGAAAQSNIPVTCWIDSAATHVYNQTVTYAGPLAPGASDSIAFPTWNSGPGGNTYNVTMYTALGGDVNAANDTVKSTTQVMSYNLVWYARTAGPAPARYWCPGTGVVRDTIYYLGGRTAASASIRQIVAFDVASGTWISSGLPVLLTPRRAGVGGRIGNKIYVACGRDSSSATLNTCQEFDVDTKTVTTKANCPAASWASCGGVVNDKLYVVGNESRTGATYEYDAAANTWATKATLSAGRGWSAATGAAGKLYVFGGSGTTELKDCWAFDPVANTWTQKADMPGIREYHTAVSYRDSVIFVLGGSVTGSTPADKFVYKYDIAANTWSVETPMITARGWEMANVVDNSIWVAYGSDCTTPTYLVNMEEGVLPLTGMEEYKLVPDNGVSLRVASPARGRPSVRYSLPRAGVVTLGVYDIAGKLVRTLASGPVAAGTQTTSWDRSDNSGHQVANGTYFFRLAVDGKSVSNKSVLLD